MEAEEEELRMLEEIRLAEEEEERLAQQMAEQQRIPELKKIEE
jgi:hypothetical protein